MEIQYYLFWLGPRIFSDATFTTYCWFGLMKDPVWAIVSFKNLKSCISMTSGPMKLILCSFVVLMSTLRPPSMNPKLLFLFELCYDFIIFTAIFVIKYHANPRVHKHLFWNLELASDFEWIDLGIQESNWLRTFFGVIFGMYMLWKKLLAVSLSSLNDRKQPTDFFPAPISDFSAHLNGARDVRVYFYELILLSSGW